MAAFGDLKYKIQNSLMSAKPPLEPSEYIPHDILP